MWYWKSRRTLLSAVVALRRRIGSHARCRPAPSDIFKGIARGADAVAVGRPYLWGLGAFGQAGVERVLEILSDELRITMRLAGTPSLARVSAASVGTG